VLQVVTLIIDSTKTRALCQSVVVLKDHLDTAPSSLRNGGTERNLGNILQKCLISVLIRHFGPHLSRAYHTLSNLKGEVSAEFERHLRDQRRHRRSPKLLHITYAPRDALSSRIIESSPSVVIEKLPRTGSCCVGLLGAPGCSLSQRLKPGRRLEPGLHFGVHKVCSRARIGSLQGPKASALDANGGMESQTWQPLFALFQPKPECVT